MNALAEREQLSRSDIEELYAILRKAEEGTHMRAILLTSSVLILVLILLRTLLRGRISLRLQYALWLLVAVRLLVPFAAGAECLQHPLLWPIRPGRHRRSGH